MLTIMIPAHHKIGDTVDVRINFQPAKLTWADKDTLIINGTDRRRIHHCAKAIDGAGTKCWSFTAGDSQADVAASEAPDITITHPTFDPDTGKASIVSRTFRQRLLDNC